jgi:tetratricopeptide (TPR) repeat protein
MLVKLSVDQMLMKARSHEKRDEITDAKELYKSVLLSFPKNKRAQDRLSVLNKYQQNNIIQSPPQEVIDQLINLHNQGQFKSMAEQAKALTEQYPEAFIIWNCLGVANLGLGKIEQASIAFKKVTELNPTYADGFNNYGVALQNEGKYDEALQAYDKVIFIKPDYVDAYYNMGKVLNDQGILDKAIEAYKKAISLKPDYAKAYCNLGVVLQSQWKLDQAITAYNKALELNYFSSEIYYNLGITNYYQGKLDESFKAYFKAISLKPDYAKAHRNLGYALLNSGRVREGLDELEWRWKTSKNLPEQRHFVQPVWDGKQSLSGKRILLWCEQGIGDTIMWSSRLSLVTSQAKHCILECQPKLVPLLKRSFPNVEVKVANRNLDALRDDFDFHLPMGSLYRNLIHDLSKNDKADAYLVPDPIRVNYWKERLKSLGKGPFIGISWKSANMDMIRLPNYATISELFPILRTPNVTFINLQYIDFANDLSKVQDDLGVTVHNFDDLDHFNNIDDVAALCTALDMVVSTKTTVPLISAAVGTSTKLANWKQSPWNNVLLNPVGSLVDIFERDTWEPWDNVFNSIAEDLFTTTKIGVLYE